MEQSGDDDGWLGPEGRAGSWAACDSRGSWQRPQMSRARVPNAVPAVGGCDAPPQVTESAEATLLHLHAVSRALTVSARRRNCAVGCSPARLGRAPLLSESFYRSLVSLRLGNGDADAERAEGVRVSPSCCLEWLWLEMDVYGGCGWKWTCTVTVQAWWFASRCFAQSQACAQQDNMALQHCR